MRLSGIVHPPDGNTLNSAIRTQQCISRCPCFTKANHPIFSGNAANNLRNSVIDEVVVCDTIPLSDEIKSLPNVRTLTLSGMLAEAIRRISNEESISAMFEH